MPDSEKEFWSQFKAARKQGQTGDAHALARTALNTGLLPPDSQLRLGTNLRKDFAADATPSAPLDIFVVGQFTTSYLVNALTTSAWADGIATRIDDGEYDNMVQDLAALASPAAIAVIAPWHQRLFADDTRTAEQRLDDELAILHQCWSQVANHGSKIIQLSYDWVSPGALGYSLSPGAGGDIALVHQLNQEIRKSLPPGSHFVDLQHLSADFGHANLYDARNYHWMKQPFTNAGLIELSRHISAGIRILTTGRKKLLILDLDNTLWGGVVGELGPHDIKIGEGNPESEAFSAFQRLCKKLSTTGVLLAACSKNNPDDAREPFDANPGMALKLDDFSAFHASWDPKPVAIRNMADELRLGLDSFVFFDDNPAEREIVRQQLPEVTVIDVPQDPADYVRALTRSLCFETNQITADDQARTQQYVTEQKRREFKTGTASVDDYLASLDMQAEIAPVGDDNIQRITQLVTKTNQFNLTNRRHSTAQLTTLAETKNAVAWSVRVSDKFGDYGIVSALVAVPTSEDTLHIDTWVMSCRVISRTVEHLLFNQLVEQATGLGYTTLTGEFIPSKKNHPVSTLFSDLGFTPEGDIFSLDLAAAAAATSHVALAGP